MPPPFGEHNRAVLPRLTKTNSLNGEILSSILGRWGCLVIELRSFFFSVGRVLCSSLRNMTGSDITLVQVVLMRRKHAERIR